MDSDQIPFIEEIRRKFRKLETLDVHLWSMSAVVILVIAAGVLALLAPNMMWNLGTLKLDGRFVPQFFFGFLVLIVLFNLHTFERRKALREAREEIFRQLIRSAAAGKLPDVDPMTEIYSRQSFDQILAKEVARADRLNSKMTLLVVDLDGFKSVNQRYGGQVGDRLLGSVGELLLGIFRRSDFVFRYGSDEFLIMLTETDESQAERAVERLLARVESWNREASLPGYRLSFSCGLATYKKGDNVSVLLDVAEQRLQLQRSMRAGARQS